MNGEEALIFLRSIESGSTATLPVRNLQDGSRIGRMLLNVSYRHPDLSKRIGYLSCPSLDKKYIRVWRSK